MIKLVGSGEIVDIQSFVEHYFSGDMVSIKADAIKEKKKTDFEANKEDIDEYIKSFYGKTYKTFSGLSIEGELSPVSDIREYSEEDISDLRSKLYNYSANYSDFEYKIYENLKVNILDKDIYLIKDFTLFEAFFYVWNYLLSEELIIIDSEAITSNDLVVFFSPVAKNEDTRKFVTLSNINFQNLNLFKSMNERRGYKSNDIEYLDSKFEFNNTEFKRYENYLGKKIITLPSLNWFIERRFAGEQEYTFKKSMRTTYLALAITILFSSLSLYFSVNSNKANTKFWKVNEAQERTIQENTDKLIGELVKANKEQQWILSEIKILLEDNQSEKAITEIEAILLHYVKEYESQNDDIQILIEVIRKDLKKSVEDKQ